ncbi:MAG: M15 family metallopeptidase [Pseudomonadales bacterium]|nr:M15 family metallopeptidase [Pseudomonadales bacterium]
MMRPFDELELTGRACTHLLELSEPRCRLHVDVVAPFLALRAAASAAGIDLVPVSSFRDFDRQLAIWNGKFRGERALLASDGARLDAVTLDCDARIAAILAWSALPGASRHHWGTDFDVIDAAATPTDYQPQLVPAEFAPGGVYAALARWLDTSSSAFGFFRPYVTPRGGVQPEPWHLSYAPLAEQARRQFTPAMLASALHNSELDGREQVLTQLDALFDRYVARIDPPDSCALLSPTLS